MEWNNVNYEETNVVMHHTYILMYLSGRKGLFEHLLQ